MRRFKIKELSTRARQLLLSKIEGTPVIGHLAWLRNEEGFVAGADLSTLFDRLFRVLSVAPDTASIVSADYGYTAPAIMDWSAYADKILEGKFDLLGFKELSFGSPIDWHLEPTSGRISPRVHWKRLDSLDTSLTGDKKVVWELNRHQHLVLLGRAFVQTGDGRYAETIKSHIESWIRENPPGIGINWVSSLELGFRCISWIWALALIRRWTEWHTLPVRNIALAINHHGRHIERYLSTYSSPNTHLTGEALALYYIGICLPELKSAARWRKLGRRILVEQFDIQIHPDGVYFEQSTWYHRYTVDFYMHFLLLAAGAGEVVPEHIKPRLATCLEHLMWITKPDGLSPLVGDDDGGRLFEFPGRRPDDWRATLSIGAVMFGRSDFAYISGSMADETNWLFTQVAIDENASTPAIPSGACSRAFVDGGSFVMRSGWTADSHFLMIDCGPHGTMNCGHAHADALGFELAALGESLLIDPGTFAYLGSPEARDLFRSTAMHNTLTVDGYSSSTPASTFKWHNIANSELKCWHDDPLFSFFEGSHDGYRRLQDPVTHTRAILFINREYWLILDKVDGVTEHSYAIHFHLAAHAQVAPVAESNRIEVLADKAALDITVLDNSGNWQINDSWVSPCYASRLAAPCASYSMRATGAVSLLTVLFPRLKTTVIPAMRQLEIATGRAFVIETVIFNDLIVWSNGATTLDGHCSADFEWIWIRRDARGGQIQRMVFLHGTHCWIKDLELKTESQVAFIAITLESETASINISPVSSFEARLPANIKQAIINGKPFLVGADHHLIVQESAMCRFAGPADFIERCKHVWH